MGVYLKPDSDYMELKKSIAKRNRYKRKSSDFSDVIKKLKSGQYTEMVKAKREADEERAIIERGIRLKKINGLFVQIAYLKQKLYTSGFDKATEAQLMTAKAELAALFFSL